MLWWAGSSAYSRRTEGPRKGWATLHGWRTGVNYDQPEGKWPRLACEGGWTGRFWSSWDMSILFCGFLLKPEALSNQASNVKSAPLGKLIAEIGNRL